VEALDPFTMHYTRGNPDLHFIHLFSVFGFICLTPDTLRFHLEEFPADFFIDELSSENFVRQALINLSESMQGSVELKDKLDDLVEFLEDRFQWDFKDVDEGEDAPVIVSEECSLERVDNDEMEE
jgi:AAR2 protein